MKEGDRIPWIVTAPSRSELDAAIVEAEGWLRPATLEKLLTELSKLYMRTARRPEGDHDRKTVLKLYAVELAKFPGDLVLAQIEAYRGTFFPALDELRTPIEKSRILRSRWLKLEALRRGIVGENPEQQRVISDQERAYVVEGFKKLSARLSGVPKKASA